MAVQQDHTLLLDQLLEQVNLIFEQTGRLFAASAANPKTVPVARAARLRHALPGASRRFHEALDKLEDELQLAKAVMRRDLAIWREESGIQVSDSLTKLEDGVSPDVAPQQAITSENSISNGAATAVQTQRIDEDVPMHDAGKQSEGDPVDAAKEPAAEAEAENHSTEPSDPPQMDSTAKVDATDMAQPNAAQPQTENDSQDGSDDKQPADTTDLDSLFNDPLSAGGAGNGNDSGGGDSNDAFDFEDNTVGANGFDFDSFGADIDAAGADSGDISSLLPGLQHYANTQPNNEASATGTADMGFDALFGTMGEDNDGTSNSNNNNEQNQGPDAAEDGQRDTTFDDLMDLATDFDGNNVGAGNGNADDALDFSSVFE